MTTISVSAAAAVLLWALFVVSGPVVHAAQGDGITEHSINLPGGGWSEVEVIPFNKIGSAPSQLQKVADKFLQGIAKEEEAAMQKVQPQQGNINDDTVDVFKDAGAMNKYPKGSPQYLKAQKDLKSKSLDMMKDFTQELGLGSLPSSVIESGKITVMTPKGSTTYTQSWSGNGNNNNNNNNKNQHTVHETSAQLPPPKHYPGLLHEEEADEHDQAYPHDDDEDLDEAERAEWKRLAASHVATHPTRGMMPAKVSIPTKESALSGFEIFVLVVLGCILVLVGVRHFTSGDAASSFSSFFSSGDEGHSPIIGGGGGGKGGAGSGGGGGGSGGSGGGGSGRPLRSLSIGGGSGGAKGVDSGSGYQTIDDETHPL